MGDRQNPICVVLEWMVTIGCGPQLVAVSNLCFCPIGGGCAGILMIPFGMEPPVPTAAELLALLLVVVLSIEKTIKWPPFVPMKRRGKAKWIAVTCAPPSKYGLDSLI